MTRTEFWQGNTACAEGALAAGCTFFGGYPITPSTEVAEHMAAKLPKKGGVFIQMEDEIASMASIIGASWTGARAMTATSGPGFSLMMENIGYAAMTETPCVVVNIQRGGPSTGQPTMSAQGDMMQVRFGSHGDYAIIALCPSSVQEMYGLTVKAFNLSDRYRVPVFLMADETIGHMREKIIIPDTVERIGRKPLAPGSLPFRADADLIPGFGQFGTGQHVHVTGLTHDERGYPCATNPKVHAALVQRLVDKIESARNDMADLFDDRALAHRDQSFRFERRDRIFELEPAERGWRGFQGQSRRRIIPDADAHGDFGIGVEVGLSNAVLANGKLTPRIVFHQEFPLDFEVHKISAGPRMTG